VFRPIRRSALGRATAAEGRLLAIYEMVRVLNSETDPEALLETMLDMAIAVVRAERGLILLEGPDGEYAVRASRNVEPDAAADAVGFSKSVVLEAAAGTPVLAIDTGDDPRLRDLRSVSLYQIRSVLCVPLRSRGRRIGAVYLDNRTGGGTFGQDDLGFLEAFADHAALALENATARRALEEENRRLRAVTETRTRLGGLVGRSNIMQRAYGRIEKFASTSHPVLILGESGTGKELAARAIHALGVRGNKPFLVENCAAVSDSLLESELFGHVRGAFTGAERDRPGLFEQADGGTLFLDEIGDTTPAMQARLLRVLQEGEVRRVGDETRRRVDVRVLAATNKDLEREVAAGRFRDDLRHRLQVLVLELPPLRERPGDIAVLVDELLERIGRERGASAPRIRLDVVDRFERYPWPGNVRQLENGLKRLAVLAGDGPITLDVVRSDDGLARMLLGDESVPAALRLDHHEKDQIQRALDAAGGNRARAAKLLGISRATIFRKLKEHGLA
jgi:transcriptional regulator with GAF, ATPase, and Fis domain